MAFTLPLVCCCCVRGLYRRQRSEACTILTCKLMPTKPTLKPKEPPTV